MVGRGQISKQIPPLPYVSPRGWGPEDMGPGGSEGLGCDPSLLFINDVALDKDFCLSLADEEWATHTVVALLVGVHRSQFV